jgi:hypothetical protein
VGKGENLGQRLLGINTGRGFPNDHRVGGEAACGSRERLQRTLGSIPRFAFGQFTGVARVSTKPLPIPNNRHKPAKSEATPVRRRGNANHTKRGDRIGLGAPRSGSSAERDKIVQIKQIEKSLYVVSIRGEFLDRTAQEFAALVIGRTAL